MEDGWESVFIETNRIMLHAVVAGLHDGPLVVLLHGFPEFWYGWRKQIGALAAAGFRVVAPDGRGYNLSEKPSGVRPYALDRLGADVVGLIAAQGHDRAIVVGHDWGAVVAWWVATRHPSWVARLAILNVPHPAIIQPYLRRHLSQLLRSWYVFFFQLPWLPEASTRLANWRAGVRALRGSSRPGTFSDADLERYREAWSQPGAFTAMINWYRALVRYPPAFGSPRVTPPTLILWGRHDAFLEPELAELSLNLCADGRLIMLETTHWVQHEAAERVNRELIGFFGMTSDE
ncbi:MAG TPA: alpha/beta fold hydrolase [Thermomicrobiales bacterium]|jgi:pimeloyl-ACP methyl ester carboxylesterase